MSKPVLAITAITLCLVGCDCRCQVSATDYYYPRMLPICWAEYIPTPYDSHDPLRKIIPRPDKRHTTRSDYALVIPLYTEYRYERMTDACAIAHPFIFEKGGDIEKQLAHFGQRERLARLIFWVPGYFPVSMPRVFRPKKDVDGQSFLVLNMQKCTDAEERELGEALEQVLTQDSFVVGKWLTRKRPLWPKEADYISERTQLTAEPYDFRRLVRTEEYEGRHFENRVAKGYVLWGAPASRCIRNRFSIQDKTIATEFIRVSVQNGAEKGQQKGDITDIDGSGME